jgi:hypothetical protein
MDPDSSGEKVDIYFPRVKEDSMAYQRDHILLEFGGRNRGKPTDRKPVVSYLSGIAVHPHPALYWTPLDYLVPERWRHSRLDFVFHLTSH